MMSSSDAPKSFSRFDLPGLNLPVNWIPWAEHTRVEYSDGKSTNITVPARGECRDLFPSALNAEDTEREHTALALTTLREFTMLHIMNEITDKPAWERKILDEDIAQKWKNEAMAAEGRDVTESMVDWIIAELRYKAKAFEKVGAVSVFNGDVVKSDTAIPSSLKEALQTSIRKLENVPEFYKDYHPGSDNKVLDLVHPSLFPLIYGESRVLQNSLVGLDNCIESCSKGVVLPVRPDEEKKINMKAPLRWRMTIAEPYSTKFQWLPCDVDISGDDGSAKITSYINNLHPQEHSDIYSIVENIISRALPLWNMTLTPLKGGVKTDNLRILFTTASPREDHMYDSDLERPEQEEGEDPDDYENRLYFWTEENMNVELPEPGKFQPPIPGGKSMPGTYEENPERRVDLKRDYGHRGLQVIVKLANIELTPEKPQYEGGTWHVEGQLNEHICATALYYYDSENITESRLAFRQQSQSDTVDIDYPQDSHKWLKDVFGCQNEEAAVQNIGSVLCSEGRLITFPNILQHQVQPFKLADQSKKGHRKILALFLVDPAIRIISTANVPPQQRDWWSEVVLKQLSNSGKTFGKLSTELRDKIFEEVEEFPISMERAKELRLSLMEERKSYSNDRAAEFEQNVFSLCEH